MRYFLLTLVVSYAAAAPQTGPCPELTPPECNEGEQAIIDQKSFFFFCLCLFYQENSNLIKDEIYAEQKLLADLWLGQWESYLF